MADKNKPGEATKPAGVKGITARRPRQARGLLRVASLLEAAEAVFAEKGYDAATMTEIASRAGASIGSLYQFFPTKEAIADEVRLRLSNELSARLGDLADGLAERHAAEIAEALFDALFAFLAKHPGLTVIAAARRTAPVAADVDRMLHDAIVRVLGAHRPAPRAEVARRAAMVVLQLLRATVRAGRETPARDRTAVLADLRGLVAAYLAGPRVFGA